MFHEAVKLIKQSLRLDAKVIIALSGGPDSKALFMFLHELSKTYPIQIHVAHFDHAYREESSLEANELGLLCKSLQIPFHSKRLEEKIPNENIEDFLREKRYLFFSSVYQQIGAEALLLGHHKDDLAETVLKRVFEGSHLTNLKGIQYESHILNMRVLRPLLIYTKQEILGFLHQNHIPYFIDRTNKDLRFLRSRIREEMIPFLEQSFGKNIINNLVKLSNRSEEIDTYLKEQIEKYSPYIVTSDVGLYIDFTSFYPLKKIEVIYLIQKTAALYKVVLTSAELEKIYELLNNKSLNKKIVSNQMTWIADRGFLFCIKNVNFTFKKQDDPLTPMQWAESWKKGAFSFYMPDERCAFKVVDLKTPCRNGYLLGDWYSRHKVPIFLRKVVPVVILDGVVYQDFLTGKTMEIKKIR